MIPEETRQEILRRLEAAEKEHGVRILYACESGSRAWGFASPDSDFDVRFLYTHTEDWYMAFDVERQRDVIEYPIVDDIDIGGWDIRKALYLLSRTNGALLEWLESPLPYFERGNFARALREMAPKMFNPIALCYHYSHMARHNAREHLFRNQVRLKKYFYVLRPLLAIRYIEKHNLPPPVPFESLVADNAPTGIRPGIANLLELKRKSPEFGLGEQIPEINDFIETELERHGEDFKGQDRPDKFGKEGLREDLNHIFRSAVREAVAK